MNRTAGYDVPDVQRLWDTLARAEELEIVLHDSLRLPVHPQSRLRHDETAGNAASCFNTASISLAGALDHLVTWFHLVAGDLARLPLPIFSHYTLARATYEPALLTLWLLDPSVTSKDRIARGYAAQLRSLDDFRKFQDELKATGDAANAGMLYERLFDDARAGGLTTTDRRGNEIPAMPVPSMIELFNTYDEPNTAGVMPSWLYRFISGHAHGREWAMMQHATAVDVEGVDTDMNKIGVDLKLVAFLAARTARVVERAVATHVHYRTDPATS
jgi:hypothetical protein